MSLEISVSTSSVFVVAVAAAPYLLEVWLRHLRLERRRKMLDPD